MSNSHLLLPPPEAGSQGATGATTTSSTRTYSQCSSGVEMLTNYSPHSTRDATRSTAPPLNLQPDDDNDDEEDDECCVIENNVESPTSAVVMDAPRSATTRRRRMRDVDDSTDDDEDEEDAPAPPSGARTKRHAAHAPAQGSRRLASAPALSDSAGGGDGDRRGATHRHRSSINLGERASVSGSSGNEEEDADAEEFGNGSDTRSQRNDAASDDGQNNDDDEDDDSTDDNEVAFYNSTIGVAVRTLGWAFSYWLLPLWVVAGSIDSGVLGLLYVSLFVWVTFVPRVERHVADVRRTKDNERFRIPVAFALAPTVACLLLSVIVATAGMVLTGVHGIWWCHREVNLDADWTVGWTKAWSVLGFNPSGSVGACTGEVDLGNHAWVHIAVFIVSVIAVFGMVVQRAKDRHYANHPPAPSQHAASHRHRHGNHHNHQELQHRYRLRNTAFPVEWTPAGLVLLAMEIGGFVWIPWACAVVSIVLRPALLQIPDLVVCLAYVLWVERYAPDQKRRLHQQQQHQQQSDAVVPPATTAATTLLPKVGGQRYPSVSPHQRLSTTSDGNNGGSSNKARLWLAYRPTVLWQYVDRSFQYMTHSNSRELLWCRVYLVYIAMSTYLYFGCLSLMRMGYSLYGMHPEVLRFLSSLDVDRSAAVSQLVLSCCSLFVVSVVMILRAIDHEEQTAEELDALLMTHQEDEGGAILQDDGATTLKRPRALPKAHVGRWGARTSAPILTALHRFFHHAWYVFQAVLVFCLANTAPSVFGCIWLLLWVIGLWAGSGQKQMHSVVVLLCTIQFVGFFIGDLHIYDPLLDTENKDKSHITVVIGVRPYQRQDMELGIWILTVMLYNLCVLRYRRTRNEDSNNSGGGLSVARSSSRVRSILHPFSSERSHTSYEEQTPLCSPKNGGGGDDGWNTGPASLRESFAANYSMGGYGTTMTTASSAPKRTAAAVENAATPKPLDPEHKPSSPSARYRTSTMASYVLDSPLPHEDTNDVVGGRHREIIREHEQTSSAQHSASNRIHPPTKVNFSPEATAAAVDPLANTIGGASSSSRRPLRREKSVVKMAVSRTEHYAVRFFSVFSELVRQYFFLIALAAVFVAAVARVNVLHVAFLILFGACLVRKQFSIFAWGIVVLYSVAVLVAQYAVVAFVSHPSQNVVQAGFTSSSGWELWPYYLLASIFLFQFRLYAITSIAELSDNVRRYLELTERVTIGLVVWLNVIFFAVLAVMSHATLFALAYLSMFVVSLVVFLESTSLHLPSKRMMWFWLGVSILNFICGVTVYVYQLFPELAEKTFDAAVHALGLTLEEAGIADDSVAALWPKLASLLLCIVQYRAWDTRRERAAESEDNRNSLVSSPFTDQRLLMTPGFAAWSHTIFSSIMTAANTLALLLSRYSLAIAVMSLFFGSAFGVSGGYGRVGDGWGGQSVLVQLLYFIIACWMTTLPFALRSVLLWRVVQILSGAATMATFFLQFPGYPSSLKDSLWPTYILVCISCATTTMQWFVLLPHIAVFSSSSIHVVFLSNSLSQRLAPSSPAARLSVPLVVSSGGGQQPQLPSATRVSISAATDTPRSLQSSKNNRGTATTQQQPSPPSGTDWLDFVFHPARHLRFFSFHASTGMMFINACVRRATFFGVFFFIMFVTVALIGKTDMARPRRWSALMVILLVVMCSQYILHLRPPPYSSGGTGDSNLEGYRHMWMIMINSFTSSGSVVGYTDTNSWLAQDSDIVAYLELKTPTNHLILTIATWCAVVLHHVGLRVFHRSNEYEEADGVAFRRTPQQQLHHRMSVTDRLAKYHAISLARRHGAMEFFNRLLPLPKGRRDFTRGVGGNYFGTRTSMPSASAAGAARQHKYQIVFDKLQLFLYQRSPLMVLVAMFLHAVYDGTTNLSVFKILSLLLVLMFLQNLHRLPWRGNRWWRYLTIFHGLWFALRLVMFVPRIIQQQWAVCVCQVLGVLPHAALLSEGQTINNNNSNSALSGGAGLHCPGSPYTLLEFSVQAAILTCAVAQYAAFEKNDYIFVLHYLHQQDVFAKCVGEAIRQTRASLLVESKQQQVEESAEMITQIEQLLEIRRQRTASGGPGVRLHSPGADTAAIVVDVQRDRSSTKDPGHSTAALFGNEPYDYSPALSPRNHFSPTAPSQPLFQLVPGTEIALATHTTESRRNATPAAAQQQQPQTPRLDSHVAEEAATTVHDDATEENTSFDDFGHAQHSEQFQSSAEFRHMLDQTLDKRSLELLANISGASKMTSHTRRMEQRAAARMSRVPDGDGGGHNNPNNNTSFGYATALYHQQQQQLRASITSGPSPRPTPRAVATSDTAPSPLELPHHSNITTAHPHYRHSTNSASTTAQHLRASHATNTTARTSVSNGGGGTAPVSTKKSGLSAAISLTWKSILRFIDAVILWLDRNSVGAGVVRLEQPMLDGHRIWFFFLGLYRCIFSFTHLLAYALFCLQFALAPCVLNAVLPISVFGYAAMMNPRPHRVYWRFCLVYIQLMILAKCLIRIGYCEPHLVDDDGRAVQVQDSILDASWLYARTCTSDFFLVDVLFGLVCVLVTISHTAYLRAWGLWNDSELLAPSTAAGLANSGGGPAAHKMTVTDIAKSVTHNLQRSDVKLGTDMYKFGFSCELLAVVILFFGYYSLVGSADSLVNSLMNSLLPGTLAVLILLLFAFIVMDRVIYLKRAILGNVFFNIGYAVFYHAVMIWWFLHQTNFVRTYFRDASFGVRGSLGLACVVYFLKCGYMMCNATQIRSGLRPHASHIAFTGSYSSWEFIVYMISRLIPFVFDMRVILDWAVVPTALKLPYWMKQEDVAHELYSLMCDREDTRVAREMNKQEKRAPYPGIFRYGIGWALFLLLTAVLMFPLFLYSSLSPVLKDNWVESVTCTLSLEGSPPLWSSASSFPKSMSSTTSAPPFQLNSTVTELMERVRPSLVNAIINTDIVQQIPMNSYSNTLWAVSPPTLHDMLDVLAHAESIAMLLTITIRNHAAIDASTKANVLIQQTILSRETRGNLSALLTGSQNSTHIPNLYTPFFTNRQSGTSSFETISNGGNQVGSANTLDCMLVANGNVSAGATGSGAAYFALTCETIFATSNVYPGPWVLSADEQACLSHDVCPNYEDLTRWNASRFAFASPTLLVDTSAVLGASFLQTIGLVAAYTTFVLAIGRVLRFATTGSAFRTALEDLDSPEDMITLLELIFFSRSRGFFDMEMELYSELILLVKIDEDRHAATMIGSSTT